MTTVLAAAACGRSGLTGRFGSGFALSVVVQGAGSVVSQPPGISCPITCDHSFPEGTKVRLVAQTNFDGVLLGTWSGCATQPDGTCTLTVTTASTVEAIFKNRVILVNTSSSFGVTGDLPCGPGETCTGALFAGPVSLLAASPKVLWSYPCPGAGAACDFTLDAPRTIYAKELHGGDLAWVQDLGGTNDDRGRAVAVAGDVYTTGKFQGTASFGLPVGDSFTSKGGDDIYVARYRDRDGVGVWAKAYGADGNNNDEGLGIACDGAGHLGLTGVYRGGGVSFDGHGVNYDGFFGPDDSYFALSSTDGTAAWALEGLANTNDQGRAVAFAGNSWVFTGFLDQFVGLTGAHHDLESLRTDGAGAVLKDKKVGSGDTNGEVGVAVAIDPVNGDQLVAGWADGSFSTDSVSFSSNNGGHDAILARLAASDGHVVWGKAFGDSNDDESCGVAVDGGGNTWLAGWFKGAITVGGTNLSSNNGSVDVFLAKFAPDGTAITAKSFGGAGDEICRGMTYLAPGRILLTGHFTGSFGFGGTIGAVGGQDAWVASIATDGTISWTRTFGETGDDVGFGIAADADGFALVTGQFQNTLDFGGGQIGHGATDGFLLRLAP